jgi:cupin 2 domain-containing protein
MVGRSLAHHSPIDVLGGFVSPFVKNLFTDGVRGSSDQEHILPLLESPNIRIERIISNGHPSPPNFWYDQERNEWVTLLRGSAKLKFEDGSMMNLKAGDNLSIAAHTKHRVEQTSSDAVWLAVHYA